MPPMITLDIISDPICPWCYIGKAHFETAVERAGMQPFEITWRPFQLNPDMPEGGMNRRDYLERKFGAERAAAFYKQIEDTAKSAGLDVRFDLIETTPNTFDAHRLIRWAHAAGAQGAVVSELFVRYFERGENIGDRDLLLEVGAGAGMERDVIDRLFKADADRDLVASEEAMAREIGVNGVPTFIVAGKHVVNGAQPPQMWEDVLKEVTEKIAAAPTAAENGAG